MPDNGLEFKRRKTESRHKDSEATFIWRTFYGGSPEIILIIFAIADQFLAPCSRGCCWYWACSIRAIASSHRGRHRKVRSRSRTEQRIRRIFAVEVWVFDLVSPDPFPNGHKRPFGCNGYVTAVAVGQRQRLYSGVRMFTGYYLSSF